MHKKKEEENSIASNGIGITEPHDAIPAWDEDSPIQRYILYTPDELKVIADVKVEPERLASLPSTEERLKAAEDALMNIMIGGNS